MNYLITGAGSGIGQSIAIELAKNGHNCFLLGRNKANLKNTLSQLKKGKHKLFVGDIKRFEKNRR
jgi:short-subunit dehydrogenase